MSSDRSKGRFQHFSALPLLSTLVFHVSKLGMILKVQNPDNNDVFSNNLFYRTLVYKNITCVLLLTSLYQSHNLSNYEAHAACRVTVSE